MIINKELTNATLDPRVGTSKVWVPTRAIADLKIGNLQNDVAVLQNQVRVVTTTVSTGTTTPTPSDGTPGPVTDVTASETATKVNGQMVSLVSVAYTAPLADEYFAGVQIWFTGYHGSNTPQLVCQGNESPVSFTTDITGETVAVTVVSVGKNGSTSDFNTAPTTMVTLNGVTTAPPAPSIAQGVVPVGSGIGWQFSFNVENGLLNDIVAGYWIYASDSDTTPTPPIGRVQYLQQPATNIGTLTYQDLTDATRYYWVSAINTAGLESTLTPANTTTVVKGFYPVSVSGDYSNPTQAYDGNETTAATGSIETTDSDSELTGTMGFAGFAAAPTGVTINKKELAIMSGVMLRNAASATLAYSLDGGSTWTDIYSVNCDAPVVTGIFLPRGDTMASRAQQYDRIPLPLLQDLSQVCVHAYETATTTTVSSEGFVTDPDQIQYRTFYGSANHSIYECRVDVTYQVIG